MQSREPETSSLAKRPSRKFTRWLYYRNRLRFAIFRRDKFRCQYCGRTVKDGIQLTLEHIVPLIKGGDWGSDNLLTACHECNEGKAEDLLIVPEAETLRGKMILFVGWPSFGCNLSLCERGVL